MKRTKNGYLPVDMDGRQMSTFPFVGVDTTTPSTQLAPGASTNAQNFTTFRGSVKKRVGSWQIGRASCRERVCQYV